jgi:hypothetical protein
MDRRLGTARDVVVVALVSLLAGVAVAQSGPYTVEASIEPPSGVTDARPFRYVIRVAGPQVPAVEPGELPKIAGLTVLGPPSTSTSMKWINGRSSSSVAIAWEVLAARPGTYEIPALEVRVAGEVRRVGAVRVQVASGPPAGPAPGPPRRREPPQESGDANVYLDLQIGARDVWVGQSVPLALSLYTAERVGGVDWVSQPSFSDFVSERDDVDPEGESRAAAVGGRAYRVYPLERRVLVAPRPGELTIEPYVMRLQLVRTGGRSAFELFPFGRTETVVRRTEPVTLRARPLPDGAPRGFGGAVGTFRVDAALDRDRTEVEQGVALRVSVEGEGSLQSVAPPDLELPSDVKVFEPKLVEQTSAVGRQLTSRRTWEWVVLPLTPGEFEIPEVRFPYFDPESGTYEIAESRTLALAVDRGTASGRIEPRRGEIRVERRDLAFIKPVRGELAVRSEPIERGLAYRAALAAPFALVPLSVWLGRRHARRSAEAGRTRGRRAGGRARKRLRSARRRVDAGDGAAFHEEVARTLVEYVADRFDRSPAGLTYAMADELLAARGVDETLRRRFRSCLETCDFARFVPASARPERRAEVLAEADGLIDALERAW